MSIEATAQPMPLASILNYLGGRFCILEKNMQGIYQILNVENGHCYIGSSENITKRWSQHKSVLRHNNHHSGYLQNAYNKYGLVLPLGVDVMLTFQAQSKGETIENRTY